MTWDLSLEQRLRERYAPILIQPDGEPPVAEEARAFTVDGGNGHVYLTAPSSLLPAELAGAWRDKAGDNEHYLYLQGRLVEGDRPNANGALWSSSDLQLASRTVAHGPLNWLHEGRHIVGTLMESTFVGREAAAADIGPHIAVLAAMWRFIWPKEAAAYERHAAAKQSWISMECVSKTVTCVAPGEAEAASVGCGDTFDYMSVVRGEACEHLAKRTSVRRLNEPTFLGAGLIVPPTRPGWANADMEIVRRADQVAEAAGLADDGALTSDEARFMVAQILQYAGVETG